MVRAVTLEVTRAEVQTVRAFIVGAVYLKMPKAMPFKTGFLVVGVVRLQWNKSELTIQGSLYADLIYQLGSSQCLFGFLEEEE